MDYRDVSRLRHRKIIGTLVLFAIGCIGAEAAAPSRPADPSDLVVDARIAQVSSGPAETSGRYRIVVVASELSLFVYFDRVTFAEEDGAPPISIPLKRIMTSDISSDRYVVHELDVAKWTSSSDVVLVVDGSHRCALHLTRDSYQASCQ